MVIYQPTEPQQYQTQRLKAEYPMMLSQPSPAAQNRSQALAAAMAMFVPLDEKPVVPLDLMDIACFNQVHIRQPALLSAIETLSLVQIGTRNQDQRILQLARSAYGKSLAKLRLAVSHIPSIGAWDGELCSTILVLTFCGAFDALHVYGDMLSHAIGVQYLLERRGPAPFDSHAEAIMFLQARMIMLGRQLSLRQRCVLDQPEWIALSESAATHDSFFGMMDIGIRLPRLLERADHALSNECETDRRRQVIQDLWTFVNDMRKYMASLGSGSGANAGPADTLFRELRDIENFDRVFSWVGRSRVFPKAWHYRSFRAANMVGICTLMKVIALANIVPLYLHSGADFDDGAVSIVGNELADEVEDLCRTIPYHVGPNAGSLGMIGCLPLLRCAVEYYTNQSEPEKSRWCDRLIDRLNNAGLAPGRDTWRFRGDVASWVKQEANGTLVEIRA